ncbi:MAG: fatty acid desaturase [Leptolyngbyaceae cyanobacterium SM2_5_2]|nr:fatty acid desaturase [Leptolyngbyaceae cyanobacterium SM2_5_2]
MSYENASDNLISQATYAKALRPLLPPAAFIPDQEKLLIIVINLAILILGWSIAKQLAPWSMARIGAFLPLAVIMANSVITLLFSSHDLFHGSVIHQPRLTYGLGFLGLTMLWMPPTLWQIVHNRVHHNTTNSLDDPDRNYLFQQPKTWGKWIQNQVAPSSEVAPWRSILGLPLAWVVYTFRNLTAVLLWNGKPVDYVPASFRVKPQDRRQIMWEFLAILLLHTGVISYLAFQPITLTLAYFLPIGLGYSGLISYIYTNHLACPMTPVNDPLINSISVQVPKILDVLHLNFSYHAEHHIFPGLNSDYYPAVRELLQQHYPERMGYVLSARAAWQSLRRTPRLYRDQHSFSNWAGTVTVPCALGRQETTPALSPALKT